MTTQTQYIEQLNKLLATYQIHYQNIRALHWNIKGVHFFELHTKYEELYTRAQLIIDELAERILTLKAAPLHRLEDYIAHSALAENPLITDGKAGITYLLESQKVLLEQERLLLQISGEMDDEGTNSLMSDLLREKEKTNWMFNAWLNN